MAELTPKPTLKRIMSPVSCKVSHFLQENRVIKGQWLQNRILDCHDFLPVSRRFTATFQKKNRKINYDGFFCGNKAGRWNVFFAALDLYLA